MAAKTLIVMFFATVFGAVGDACLSKGMKQVGEVCSLSPADLWCTGLKAASNGMVLAGVGMLALFFFLWLAVLSWADLSVALPMTAFSYVVGAILARYWLGEDITAVRWMGTVLICVGVALVTRSVK